MPPTLLSSFLVLMTVLLVHGPEPVTSKPHCGSKIVKSGYWPYWATDTSNLNFEFQTHVFFAFAQIDPVTYEVVPPPPSDGVSIFPTFTKLARKSNKCVKTLLSIGGGGSMSPFSAMASSAANRKAFIQSSIQLALNNSFDGLDLDWEFPDTQVDMDNLAILLKEWRAEAQKKLLLTAAVYFRNILYFWQPADQQRRYPIASINKNLDWINVMCFDYRGSWESNTGEHTALYDPNLPVVSTDDAVTDWITAGLYPHKLVMGLAFYGKQWTLQSLANTGIGAPTQTDISSKYTPVWSEIVVYLQNDGWTTVLDDATVSMYSYNTQSLQWVGYDNEVTIKKKVEYAIRIKKLKGVFVWSLNHDDSNWSLARAVASCLNTTFSPWMSCSKPP
ncbi:class V chitinase CHIT5 [Physcomitrium patens]|uniref:GH18 domain-containing protein n=1 Tax=Physcomitrium patens TaxID=3218 RepID=A0A2K1KLB5_PHYPA|nr:class V chitinase-like [Physcomitrium patens]PNR54559.1 hypothetical protein PHYPA_008236 [Physcomitrium patens]|eukprot:XP_024375474.1 class V chitinase-like [Physcomitrella patens]